MTSWQTIRAQHDEDETLRLRLRREWYAALGRGEAEEWVKEMRRSARRTKWRGRLLRARLWALHIIGLED